jgi:hypothetical protein
MEKELIKTWGVSLILFLAVFVCCIFTIFRPIEVYTETAAGTTVYWDYLGMSKTWVKNPDYFSTVGITGCLALIGAGWTVYMMNKSRREK